MSMINKALEQAQLKFGGFHYLTLKLKALHSLLLEPQESQSRLQEIVKNLQQIKGKNYYWTIAFKFSYGAILLNLAKFDSAETQLNQAIERMETSKGTEHFFTLTLKGKYAKLLKSVGKHEKAELIFEVVIKGFKSLNCYVDEIVYQFKIEYVECLRELQKFKKADQLLTQLISQQSLTTQETIHLKLVRAQNLSNMKRQKEAQVEYSEILEQMKKEYSPNDELYLNTLLQYAFLLAKHNKEEESKILIKKVKSRVEEAGQSHPMWSLFENTQQ